MGAESAAVYIYTYLYIYIIYIHIYIHIYTFIIYTYILDIPTELLSNSNIAKCGLSINPIPLYFMRNVLFWVISIFLLSTHWSPERCDSKCGLRLWAYLVKLPSDECQRTHLMISQHSFGKWLGDIKLLTITLTNNDQDLSSYSVTRPQWAKIYI